MRLHFLSIIAIILITSCTAPIVTSTSTATVAPTLTQGVDPCMAVAQTYQPGLLPPARIAFGCYTDANRVINIYVFDTTTGRITDLTNHPSINEDIQWSPDGRTIAFCSNRDNKPGIYLVDVDSYQSNWLADGKSPRWSPNSKNIAFVRDDGVYVMNADGGQVVRLANNAPLIPETVWSPDGKKIAFNTKPNGLYIVNADGTQKIKLTDYSVDFGELTWSPAGDRILFLSSYEGPLNLYQINTNSSSLTQLASTSKYVDVFALSPNGKQIVFVSDKVYLMNSDGSQIRVVSNGRVNHLSWSPDSQYLTFAVDQLAVVKADDGQVIDLTAGPAFKDYPAWAPK